VSVRFATYNLRDLTLDSPLDREQLHRFEQAGQVIRALDADVVAVQEIISDDPQWAGQCLARLADLTGLSATVVPGRAGEDDAQDPRYAIGVGGHRFHVGLMWKPNEFHMVPGSFKVWGPADFWHSLTRVVLVRDGGPPVQYASYHARPFGRRQRADDAERVVGALTRPLGSPPAMLGADSNCISADRSPDGSFYETDWYASRPWHDDFVYQCDWAYDKTGVRRHWADRTAGDVLYAGGLHDAAAALHAPWQPSSGHWPGDPFGPRRVDTIRVTSALVPALRAVEVARTDLALAASDHLPVVVTYDPNAIAHQEQRP
jgi:endonuclease/exonuclease/phosphatase family metal-dependent hydrolase